MLMTGMPAAVAFCATGVSASPSLGRTTSASGLLVDQRLDLVGLLGRVGGAVVDRQVDAPSSSASSLASLVTAASQP